METYEQLVMPGFEVPVPPEQQPGRLARLRERLPLRRIAGSAVAASALAASLMVGHHELSERDDEIGELTAENERLDSELGDLRDQGERLADIATDVSGSSESLVRGTTLRHVSELPGFGREVSEEQKEALRSATVKLGVSQDGGQTFESGCNALLVKDDRGNLLASTAAHCYSQTGFIINRSGMARPATNITKFVPETIGVFAADADVTSPTAQRLATVESIAVDTTGITDSALLELTSEGSALQTLNPVPLDSIYTLADEPVPGEEVYIYGANQQTGSVPAENVGIYLGRTTYTQEGLIQHYRPRFLVGVRASTKLEDPCFFGNSGESAQFRSGGFSGPLSTRNSSGYSDPQPPEEPNSPYSYRLNRLEVERALGLDLDEFRVICGFTLYEEPPDSTTTNDTRANLLQALYNPEDPPYAPPRPGK